MNVDVFVRDLWAPASFYPVEVKFDTILIQERFLSH